MPETFDHTPTQVRRFSAGGKLGLAAAGLLALGGAAGAVVMAQTRPSVTMAPTTPVPIRSLSSSGIISVRGTVAEIYGNKFVMADASGRALVDTGPEGDDHQLVTTGEPVTVQGRFERGFVHAAFLVGPDNKVIALGPLAGPPHGPRDPRGPAGGLGAPPPPPPPAGGAVPPPLAQNGTPAAGPTVTPENQPAR